MSPGSAPTFLRMRVVEDAVLVPRARLGDKELGAGVLRHGAGGLVPVEGTGVRRRGREYVLPPPTEGIEPQTEVDAAVYAGFLFSHYGHFLLESLSRLWFAPAGTEHPVTWIAGTAGHRTTWMDTMLDELGVSAPRQLVDEHTGPVRVRSLLVPDPGFEVQRFLHPLQADRLAVRPHRPSGARVWLGRASLGDLAGVAEEDEIEALLEDAGWTVVHPESLTIAEQIDVLAGASHVAGIEGSALHTLCFVRGYSGTVDIFTRHDSRNYEVIAATEGWDQVRHPLPGGTAEVWKRASGARDVRWSGVDAAALVRSLEASVGRR